MFARILNFDVKPEKKEDLVKALKHQIVPILKRQNGFLEILPFFPEKMREEKVCVVSLWTTPSDAERYERDVYSDVHDLLKPFLTTSIDVKRFHLETSVCERFVESLAA
jgi:heme-degrading monooxygenase HmoA